MDDPTNGVRIPFEKNVAYVARFLQGRGLDMGCGSCPLLLPNVIHVDHSPQPLTLVQIENIEGNKFIQMDSSGSSWIPIGDERVDFIFSSHMIEDLLDRDAIIDCIEIWSEFYLKRGGYIVLLIPDMQGGRYPTVEEGANPSHRTNVGKPFFEGVAKEVVGLDLVQIDTIPHDESETMDVVFQRRSQL